MIPKEWRDYKWEFRPIVVLVFILVSPAMVMILLLIWSAEGVDWPAWVQAVGSVLGIAVAIWVPAKQRDEENKKAADDIQHMELGRAQRLSFICSEIHRLLGQLSDQVSASANLDIGDTALILERHLFRLDNSFDSELNSIRLELSHDARVNLALLIYMMQVHSSDQPLMRDTVGEVLGNFAKICRQCAAHRDEVSSGLRTS